MDIRYRGIGGNRGHSKNAKDDVPDPKNRMKK